jgi:hypothetical protein
MTAKFLVQKTCTFLSDILDCPHILQFILNTTVICGLLCTCMVQVLGLKYMYLLCMFQTFDMLVFNR